MGLIADGGAEKVGHDAGPVIDDGEEQNSDSISTSSDVTDGAMEGLQGGIVLFLEFAVQHRTDMCRPRTAQR